MKLRKLLASFALAAVTVVSIAPVASAGPNCAPGQHGNKKPGYKPAACQK